MKTGFYKNMRLHINIHLN